jgi:hypothetical protein
MHVPWCTYRDSRTVMNIPWCTYRDARTVMHVPWCTYRDARTVMHAPWCTYRDAHTVMHGQQNIKLTDFLSPMHSTWRYEQCVMSSAALKLFPGITIPRDFVSHGRSEERHTCSDHYSSCGDVPVGMVEQLWAILFIEIREREGKWDARSDQKILGI